MSNPSDNFIVVPYNLDGKNEGKLNTRSVRYEIEIGAAQKNILILL
jgi:hypothetical protein